MPYFTPGNKSYSSKMIKYTSVLIQNELSKNIYCGCIQYKNNDKKTNNANISTNMRNSNLLQSGLRGKTRFGLTTRTQFGNFYINDSSQLNSLLYNVKPIVNNNPLKNKY